MSLVIEAHRWEGIGIDRSEQAFARVFRLGWFTIARDPQSVIEAVRKGAAALLQLRQELDALRSEHILVKRDSLVRLEDRRPKHPNVSRGAPP